VQDAGDEDAPRVGPHVLLHHADGAAGRLPENPTVHS
jgi:hypothetical protein